MSIGITVFASGLVVYAVAPSGEIPTPCVDDPVPTEAITSSIGDCEGMRTVKGSAFDVSGPTATRTGPLIAPAGTFAAT